MHCAIVSTARQPSHHACVAESLADLEIQPGMLVLGEQLGEGQFGKVLRGTAAKLPNRVLFAFVTLIGTLRSFHLHIQ